MYGIIIVRDKEIEFEPYKKRADDIFLKIYDELGWGTFNRFKKARRLSILYAFDIKEKLTNTGSVVITKSEKKLRAVETYWDGVLDAIISIEKIK